MFQSGERDVLSFAWGTAHQLFACRVFQVLGLLAVLGMLVAFGWTP